MTEPSPFLAALGAVGLAVGLAALAAGFYLAALGVAAEFILVEVLLTAFLEGCDLSVEIS